MKVKIALLFLLIITLFTGILIYKIPHALGAITLSQTTENGLHLVQINADNLPAPFFGTAFHLYYNPALYTFDHYEPGDYFKDTGIDPLILAENNDDTIVAGITLHRGQVIDKKDGSLINLYFKRNPPDTVYPFNTQKKGQIMNSQNADFSFSEGIFSTYSGKRVDIQNIIFKSD